MSGYTLYGYPTSGSGAIEVALVAANIPFEMRELDPDAGALESDAFLAINPRGQVPTLIHPDGSVITEVPAILAHLADAHPGCGLAPEPGSSARAQHDRWLAFAHANCYEGVLRVYYSDRYTTDPAQAEPVSTAALAYVIRHLNMMADAIETGPFMFGADPMAVDYLVWIITTWLVEKDLSDLDPKILSRGAALAARPELKEVVARNTE